MISYDDIVLFSTVAKIGSFIKTSKILGISHTTIARRIKNLEDSIGTVLINRSSHNFGLTFTGQQIYDIISNCADDYINIIQQIEERVTSQGKNFAGNLTIALPPVLHKYILAPYIVKFINLYPDVKLHLVIETREINLIKEGIDLAISFYIPKQQDQKFKKLFNFKAGLYCTKKYAEKYGVPQTPLDIKNYLIVSPLLQSNLSPISEYKFTNIHNGDIMQLGYKAKITVDNGLHLIEYALTDEAISPMLSFVANKLSQEFQLINVLPDYHVLDSAFYIFSNQFANFELINLFTKFISNILATDPNINGITVLSQS